MASAAEVFEAAASDLDLGVAAATWWRRWLGPRGGSADDGNLGGGLVVLNFAAGVVVLIASSAGARCQAIEATTSTAEPNNLLEARPKTMWRGIS